MKGLASNVSNVLRKYKSTIHIKKRDVLAASRAAAKRARIDNSTVGPDITNNSDTQDEADQQNVFFLAAIGVNEGIMEGITKNVRWDIANPILRTTGNSDLKSVDQIQIHQFFTAITEGAEIQESTNIQRQFVNIVGKNFDWRETVVENVK